MKPLTAEQRQDAQRWRDQISGLARFPDQYLYSLQRRYMEEQCGAQAARPTGQYLDPHIFAQSLMEWGVITEITQTWDPQTLWRGGEPLPFRHNPSLEVR